MSKSKKPEKHSSMPPFLPFLKAPPLSLDSVFGTRVLESPMKSPTTQKNSKFVVGLGSKSPMARSPIGSQIAMTPDETIDSSFSPVFSHRGKSVRLSKPPNQTYRSLELLSKSHAPTHRAEVDDAETFKKRLTTPYTEEKLEVVDQTPQHILGQEVTNKFYSHYKKLDKVKDVNSFMQVKDAVFTSVLGKAESLYLLPSKIGFIKEKGDIGTVKLNHFRLGDKYAEVLSEGIKSMKGFDKLELSNNRITQVGADALLSKLNGYTQIINLSGNNIGKIGADHLCTVIQLKNSRLIEVNLEGNKLGDSAVGLLCDAVSSSSTMTKLNLGKNFLSDNVVEKIVHMLEYSDSLEELYLQWNQIKSPGGTTLVNGLKAASKLRVLDLSWNSLGQNGSQWAKTFASYIGANTTLVHLDLSHNYITKPDAIVIAEELKANHTLYGFHFIGNVGYVDFKGFLIVPDDVEETVTGRIIQPPIHSVDSHPESLKHHIGNFGEYKDVCWICEGWRPMEFTWEPGQCGLGDTEPVYAHLSFEGYKGVYLPKRNGFKNVRMVPPNKFEYFYHLEDTTAFVDTQPSDSASFPNVKAKVGEEEKELRLGTVNLSAKTKQNVVLDEDYDAIDMMRENDIKPRVPDEVYIAPDVIVIRPPWKFPVSIFRTYRPDTQALLDDCFKVDMENARIAKVAKKDEELKQVRDILYASYRALKDCYKHSAVMGAISDIWSIPLNTYTELCQNSKIIDNKTMKLSDFDRVFIATHTKSEKEKNPRNPDRVIVRHTFFEGLVRLAENKYLGNNIAQNIVEAVQMIMTENMIPYIASFNHQKWREDRYWNENVDIVLKSYFPIIRGVFRKYYGTKTLPGQKKYMALDEFRRLITDAALLNDNCGERDATLAFGLAMMTQVDELNSDRIFQMQFVEFLEALARLSEKFSAHPYGYLVINPDTGIAENEIPYEKRTSQPLHIKIEGIMPFLYAACGNDVKEIWVMPDTSVFSMQEVDPRVRYTTKKKKIVRINPTSPGSIEPYEGLNALQV